MVFHSAVVPLRNYSLCGREEEARKVNRRGYPVMVELNVGNPTVCVREIYVVVI